MARRTAAQLNRLRDALLEIHQLRLPKYRDFYVQQWEEQFGTYVDRFGDAKHDIASILRTAEQVPGGMRGWADIVVDGQGRTDPVVAFLTMLECDDAPAPARPASAGAAIHRVFGSYARDDDRVTYGRISRLLADLDAAYRNDVGVPAGIFQDNVSIKVGEDWREELGNAHRAAAILLAFVSPAYLRSEWCRRELTDFLDRPGPRTVLPLLYYDRDRLVARFGEDDVWRRLDRLQMEPVTALRSADPGSSEWIGIRDRIATRIAELLANPLS
jgi:hypothetical protein